MANVLVIDDDPTVRDVLGDMLTMAGYCVAAADGITAMDEFERKPFDVVIADIFMPGEDGITTIRRIRDQDPFVGIVAITGGAKCGTYDVLRIRRAGRRSRVVEADLAGEAAGDRRRSARAAPIALRLEALGRKHW